MFRDLEIPKPLHDHLKVNGQLLTLLVSLAAFLVFWILIFRRFYILEKRTGKKIGASSVIVGASSFLTYPFIQLFFDYFYFRQMRFLRFSLPWIAFWTFVFGWLAIRRMKSLERQV